MMGCLFGDVVGPSVIWQFPIAGEDLAQNRIQGLFDTWWTDMPPRKIEFHDRHESLGRVVDIGYGQEHLGMAHEAINISVS